MAVRGILTTIQFFPEDYINTTPALYRQQNHFAGSRVIDGDTYTYNSFQVSSNISERDSAVRNMSITFAATAANVDLVEAAIQNNYVAVILGYRWSEVENPGGIDNPTTYNIFSEFVGNSLGGSSDFSTVTLEVGRYSDGLNSDLPWRKIPWTILGPLSFRR